MATLSNGRAARVERFLARAVMFVMGGGIAFVGATLLTTPLAIPVTVALWLGAAAIVGLGVWGRLPEEV